MANPTTPDESASTSKTDDDITKEPAAPGKAPKSKRKRGSAAPAEGRPSDPSGMERAFAAALRAAEEAPASADAWDHVEELADKLQRPDEVADLYRALLERRPSQEVFAPLAERAVQFQEEWFGDTPEKISSLLSRIIEIDPSADWAFERLSLMLTSSEQWEELLSVYDRTLGHTQDRQRRRQLLHDAAQAAKDFAGAPEKAAGYMQQLLQLEPNNVGLVTSLERLLEKSERWTDLIALWEQRLDHVTAEERRDTYLRIAGCWLERLGDAARALDVARTLLAEHPGLSEACELGERILSLDGAEIATRRQALSLLRKNYLVAERPDDVIRVLEKALALVEPDERRPLHREAATRLAILGRDTEAIEHYRQLLLGDPTDADARKQLRQLAKRSGRQDLHARALIDAADAASDGAQKVAVLAEAAQLHRSALGDAAGAIELYSRVLDSAEAEPSVALAAAHNVNELLAAAGRHHERLAVLERLASLERSSAVRRHVLGEAARLADELGDPDRALANWKPVLAHDEQDLEALAAVTELLERNKRHEELVEVLRRRSEVSLLREQRRADRMRIAQVQEKELERVDDAIDTWLEVRQQFGDDAEVIEALDRLMTRAGRHRELAQLLGEAAGVAHGRAAGLLVRLADILVRELKREHEALIWYARAAAIDPRHEGARAGLEALLSQKSCAGEAAEVLARAYRDTGNWQAELDLLEARLGATRNKQEKARMLREAAAIHLEHGEDSAAALACLCRALPFEPDNLATEAQLMQLAQHTGGWREAARGLGEAAEAVGDALSRAAQLRKSEAAIHETWLDDPGAALDAYRAAAETLSGDAEAFEAIARCGARARQWDVASAAAIRSFGLRDRITRPVVASLEAGIRDEEDWRALASALAAALAAKPLRAELGLSLELTIAFWFRDRCADLDAAEQAAARAVEHAPSHLEALELLASLQRRSPGPPLVTTLIRLNRVLEQSLDPLFEAAQLASSSKHDVAKTRSILEQLYRKAAGMWIRNEATTGEHAPSEVAQWALDRLIDHHITSGDAERAVHTLLEGTRLPLETDKIIELRRRAGEMLAERGERGRAIDVYRAVLDERPNDIDALRRVAALCEAEGRVSEALSLRLRELDMIEDVERRLELRLDHSRLTGALEERGGRVASLRANLQDRPGHEPSIDELCRVLEERGRHADLCEILTEQAHELERRDEPEAAARLWLRVAALAEKPLGDMARAIAAYARVVDLAATNEALDALARLHLERNEPAEAASWLERRLESTAPGDRVAVLLKLAHARIQAEQGEAAIAALATAFDDAPRNAEVRKLLLGLYRQSKDWEALARTLAKAALHIADERTILSYAREAAAIYMTRLERPDAAVPVLRKAVELAPDDRELRSLLAEGLRVAGELDEARALLEALVADFGRRRSPERAQVHLQLARVAHAQGSTDEALDQLETASRMDAGSITIVKELAELALEAGQLERAERAYRTLLVTVRREADIESLPVGPTEVLLELSRIAHMRGDEGKRSEVVESVLESLASHDLEAARIQQKLRNVEDWPLLERVLRRRLDYVTAAHRRAQIHAELGEMLERLERMEESFDERLEAVRTDPGSPVHHQAARDQAVAQGRLDGYVSAVEALLSDERADSSAHVRCELLLRLGEVLEKERGDLDRAAALYERAEATGVRKVDVWRAQARVAGARGDSGEQMRRLGLLANLGEDQVETRADALYRLAEVQLASEATVEEGLASLDKALNDAFRAERAALILRRASEQHAGHAGLLDRYDGVARRCGDERTLLHYLERRALHAEATPEQAREAVEKALELDEAERAETLMLRAAEIGRGLQRAEDLARVDWAFLGLAERRLGAGDLAGAVKWLSDAAEVADLDAVFALGARIAARAAEPEGDPTLAAKLYERLLERAPSDARAWRPLADIYARLDDVEALERMVEETLDGLQEPADRNALRVSLARALLASQRRVEDAIEMLEQVLVDEPQQSEAYGLLVEHLDKSGRLEELVQLLRKQLEAAIERRDEVGIKVASLGLVERIEREDRDEALSILRAALRWAPEDVELLEALVSRLGEDDDPRQRADCMEALVRVEEPERAAQRAVLLVALYDGMEDDDAALRALQLGARRAPDDERIRAMLLERYRARGDFYGLADNLAEAAAHVDEPRGKARLLAEAARIRRDELGDPQAAAQLLAQAYELAADSALCIELARAQAASGQLEQALGTLSARLDGAESSADALPLLRARAGLSAENGRLDEAQADLEQAHAIDARGTAEELERVVHALLERAARSGDADAVRRHTLRNVELLLGQGKREEASELLARFVESAADDVEALRRLRDIDMADARWKAVAATCRRLVELESGAAQIDAALGLSHACHELGEPQAAREGLERARAAQPSNLQVRAELRKIYELDGDRRALAILLVDDAAAISELEERVSLLLRAGQLFIEVGDADAAVPALRTAHELMPSDPTATAFLADAYILAGWLDDARELLDRVLAEFRGRRTPEVSMYYHRKAQLAAARGDHREQLELLLEAHLCNKKNGPVAAELANLAEELGAWDIAAKTLRTITLLDTDCPIRRAEAFLRQGRIAHRQGDDKSARMWARRAKREDPDWNQVDEFLAELGERI